MSPAHGTPVEFPERFNQASYFLDRNLDEGRGEHPCLYYRDEVYTYRQVQAQAHRCANALRALGVRLEDRVLLALSDRPEFVVAWFGAAKAGAVIAMVNPGLPAEDYAHYFEYTRARVAVVDAATAERLEPMRDGFRHLEHLVVVGASEGGLAFDELLAAESEQCQNADTHRDDPAIWLFTSGSTGKPKAAVHLHHDLPWNAERYARQVLHLQPNDITLSVPKLFFGYATGMNLLFPFAAGGATALFSERSEPATLFAAIERYRPTVLTAVPTMINAMLNEPDAQERDLSSLRLVVSAGEALPPELFRRFQAAFGVEILDGIGSAEMFHIYISNRRGEVVPGSLGRLVPGYEARVVDPEGRDCADDQPGRLWIRGDSAAVAYVQAHAESKACLQGDWVVSGDVVRRDAAGCFWYEGRADDLLKVGGVFVSPLEVENCLLQHPQVAECAVIGYKAAGNLVKPKAIVVLREGRGDAAMALELQAFVKARLAAHKYPRRVEFVDALPKNDRGKIDRRRLESTPPE